MLATLIINGVDFTPYIKPEMAYSWTAFDGENAGRNLAGNAMRDFLTEKDKIELQLIPLTNIDFWRFSDILRGGKDLTVQYQGVASGALKTIICYCTSYSGAMYSNDEDDASKSLWTNVQFNLIEL